MANKDLEALMKDLDDKAYRVEGVNILFLDVSSTCTGYTIHNVNFSTKSSSCTRTGAIWLDPKWRHEEKYLYMYSAIANYFWIAEKIDHIVLEQYSINPKKLMGIHVVPEMIGAIKTAAAENGLRLSSMLPQSWRSILKIKKANGDYKIPTKNKVLEYASIPEQSVSNITGNTRRTPFDVYDSMALAISWLDKLDIKSHRFDRLEFNKHINMLEK